MTDQEIIQKLIDKDPWVTKSFFFDHCKPLFLSIIKKVFDYPVDYDEFVNELYVHLMENDARRLRTVKLDGTLYGWLLTTATRYFRNKKNHGNMIDDEGKDTLYEEKDSLSPGAMAEAQMDVEWLLGTMSNERYVFVIRKLVLEDMDPEELAGQMGVTTANLYNIKKRAIAQMTQMAIDDIKNYKKRG